MRSDRDPDDGDRRPRIGVIAGWQFYERTTPNWFLEALFRGVAAAARELGCDVLVSCGVDSRIDDPRKVRPGWPVASEDTDFVPVGPWNTDGLIFVSPLRTPERKGYARSLQAEGFPAVYVGSGDGEPAIVADTGPGFRQALEHLRAHGHRRIAFVSGDPLDNGDSLRRLSDFKRLRHALGLDESDLLTAPGLHSEQGGYDAMRLILGTGRSFSALVASNDVSAVGAMRALRESGRRVPDDVAVVGFDDQPGASAHVPPLATVRYPLALAGRRAVDLLLRLVRGEALPEGPFTVPTTLVPRRSCGCLHPQAEAGPLPESAAGSDAASGTAGAMAAAVVRAGSTLSEPAIRGLCSRMVEGFESSLRAGRAAAFEAALVELLQVLEEQDDRAHHWHAALSRLRRQASLFPTDASPTNAEDLVHLGRLALSESADRQESRRRLKDLAQADLVSALTVPLQSALDESQILALIAAHAPDLGLRPVCMALYEGEGDDPVRWSKVRFLTPSPGSLADEARIETRLVLRDHLPPAAAARILPVLPLVRHGRAFGFLAFEADNLAPGAAIARQLAVALESVRLQTAVRALTMLDELTGLHNRRFFELELRREAERARRFKRHLALVLIDVDHFKDYNDTFGHRAGDNALRRVAGHLTDSAARRVDAIARYGGEEFAILLAETDVEGARLVAERIRESVAKADGMLRPLTISAGVAALHGEASDGEALVLLADEALYQAKRDGRNRVSVAPPTTPRPGTE
jgi:diguanylate cyclase (GGDEF)-like protein